MEQTECLEFAEVWRKPGHKYERVSCRRVHIGELKVGTVVRDAGISLTLDFGYGHIVSFSQTEDDVKLMVQFQNVDEWSPFEVSAGDLTIYI